MAVFEDLEKLDPTDAEELGIDPENDDYGNLALQIAGLFMLDEDRGRNPCGVLLSTTYSLNLWGGTIDVLDEEILGIIEQMRENPDDLDRELVQKGAFLAELAFDDPETPSFMKDRFFTIQVLPDEDERADLGVMTVDKDGVVIELP